MKKLTICILSAFIFASCAEESTVVVKEKRRPATSKKKSGAAEDFRAVEKPSTYSR